MAGGPARRERKVVTVVFCDLVGFTTRAESLDPEDVEAILRPYHERVRAELERHGGTVEKFIGDAVMALFGAPTAHEDDPERAVRAALAIREFALEEELELRVGITTGEALVSLDAQPDSRARAWPRATSSTPLPACRAPPPSMESSSTTRRIGPRALRSTTTQPRARSRPRARPSRSGSGLRSTHARASASTSRTRRAPSSSAASASWASSETPSSAPATHGRRSSSHSSACPGSARAASSTS